MEISGGLPDPRRGGLRIVVYAAALTEVLEAIDVSDPGKPRALASIPLPGQAYDIAVSGNHACASNRSWWQ